MDARSHLHDTIDEILSGNPQRALAAVHWLQQAQLPWLERHAVRRGRSAGFNWAEIGRLLGRSRQATRKRYTNDVAVDRLAFPLPPRGPGAEAERDYLELVADARRSRWIDDPAGDAVPW